MKSAKPLLLQTFSGRPDEWRFGYELSLNTGLRHGTLYPLLQRMESAGLLESCWEHDGGRVRHKYRLTTLGRQTADSLPDEVPIHQKAS